MIQQKYKLGKELELQFRDCEEIWIAAAMISDGGLNFIEKTINKYAKQNYLVGIGLPTSPSVLKKIGVDNPNNVSARVFHKAEILFHPKVYIIKSGNKLTAFVGSGNCTEGGFDKNIEVSLKTDDIDVCNGLLIWFNSQYKQGKSITNDFIEKYNKLFENRRNRLDLDKKDIKTLFPEIEINPQQNISLENIDFTNQYFKRKHFEIFRGNLPSDESDFANKERQDVKRLLYKLRDKLNPKLKERKWDLHEHYEFEHIISSDKHGSRTGDELNGMWLHYGRSKPEIKDYGEKETPLDYMRLQVIINANHVGIWNRIGKNMGSKIDRDNLKFILTENSEKAEQICLLLLSLPKDYFIHLNDETRYVNEFQNTMQLKEYLLSEKLSSYFIIGKEYTPENTLISEQLIIDTILLDLKNLYPIYQLIKHKL